MGFSDLVSIVTPAYNAERFLTQTIDSVVAQSHSKWELIVADDCSTDASRAVVEAYVSRDSRIHLVRLERNSGPAMARQAALQVARGRYIAFLDSDDIWLPDKLTHQLDFMKQHRAALSFTGFRRIQDGGSRLGRIVHVPRRLTYDELLGNTAIATSTAMIDRELTGPFRMVKTYYDDFALWLEITRRGFPAYGLDEDLMRYRVVGGSVSRHKGRSAAMVWRTYRDIECLSVPRASWAFARYVLNAVKKYARF